MLRTSRQSNYWGLVQQRGPWDETKIDIQNLRNTKVVNLGGGVDNGVQFMQDMLNGKPRLHLVLIHNIFQQCQIHHHILKSPELSPDHLKIQ